MSMKFKRRAKKPKYAVVVTSYAKLAELLVSGQAPKNFLAIDLKSIKKQLEADL